ncbi:hypothetical protein ACF2JD_03005 [Aeromonas sp. A-5]|uniref:hypothetical protein n=1 Tax=Aeromonas ichthyocola TaxID=3367746 RepID=UPI0038E5CFC6
MDAIGFYGNDEGICCDIILESFVDIPVQVVNLETYEIDDKFRLDIEYLRNNQREMNSKVNESAFEYIKIKYNSDSVDLKLIKVYAFHDEERIYGLVFTWDGGSEHGVGVKVDNTDVIKVGPAEVSFI